MQGIRDRVGRVLFAILALVVMALAVNAVRATVTPIIHYAQSFNWVQTEGEILQSDVEVVNQADGTRYYHAGASYRYVANGETHTGERLFFGQWDGPVRGDAQQIVDRYPPGQAITVYYNPADPAQAVVERRVGRGPWLALPLALLFAVGTVGIPLYVLLRRLRRTGGVSQAAYLSLILCLAVANSAL